jgi:hypothetical protein
VTPPVSAARAEERDAARERVRAATRTLVHDVVRVGAAHLSADVRQRVETTALWAQSADYWRLADVLRRVEDQMELLLARSSRGDERTLLDLVALTAALVDALDAAPDEARLVGSARQRYESVSGIDLVGLGGMPWERTGYVGLTCLFWQPDEVRFLSWTDARPDTMWSFDARKRYDAYGPWTGLGSPRRATGRGVFLEDARISDQGRISGVEATQARMGPGRGRLRTLPVVSSWSELGRREHRSLLEPGNPLLDWAVLQPAFLGPAVFEPVRQVVRRDLVDADGEVLPLELRWTPATAHGVARVEGLALPEGAWLVCRVPRTATGFVAEPLSVVLPEEGVVDCLHFDDAPGDQAGTPAEPRRGKAAPEDAEDETAIEARDRLRSGLPRPAQVLDAWLVRQLERGTGATAAGLLRATLDAHHRECRAVGLSVFPAVSDEADPAEVMLRSLYLTRQLAQVLA